MSSQAIMVKLAWMADAMGNRVGYAKHWGRFADVHTLQRDWKVILEMNRFWGFQNEKVLPKSLTAYNLETRD